MSQGSDSPIHTSYLSLLVLGTLLLSLCCDLVSAWHLIPLDEWLPALERPASAIPLGLWELVAFPLGFALLFLCDRLQILDKQRATVALLASTLLYYLLGQGLSTQILIGILFPLVGISIYRATRDETHAPQWHLLIGSGVGGLALIEARTLYLLPMLLLSMNIGRGATRRNTLALLMGLLSVATTALPLLYLIYREDSLGLLGRWKECFLDLNLHWVIESHALQILPYLTLLLMGLSVLILSQGGNPSESLKEQRGVSLYRLWSLYLIGIGIFSGGADSLFSLMAIFPTSLALSHYLKQLDEKALRLTLGIAFTLLSLLFLIPQTLS